MAAIELERYLRAGNRAYHACLEACAECLVACAMCSDVCRTREAECRKMAGAAA